MTNSTITLSQIILKHRTDTTHQRTIAHLTVTKVHINIKANIQGDKATNNSSRLTKRTTTLTTVAKITSTEAIRSLIEDGFLEI